MYISSAFQVILTWQNLAWAAHYRLVKGVKKANTPDAAAP